MSNDVKKETPENQSGIVYLLDDDNYVKPSGSVLKSSLKEVYGDSGWQLFNPLNVLEAMALLPANAADRACLLGMPMTPDAQLKQGPKPSLILKDASISDDEDLSLPVNPPTYAVSKRRKWLRAGVNLLVRMPHKLIQPLSSPKKFFFAPMNKLRTQHPRWLAAVMLGTVLLTTFITVSLFAAGLPGFMLALGLSAAHVGVALASATGLGIAVAVIIAKIATIAVTIVASGKLLQALATEAAGLRQYQLTKYRSDERLFDVTEQQNAAEQLSNGQKEHDILTIEPQNEQERIEFEACAKTFNKAWEIIQLGYPKFRVKLPLSPQKQALIGYLLKKEISDENALQSQLYQVLENVEYKYLSSELVNYGSANNSKPVIVKGIVDKLLEAINLIVRAVRSEFKRVPQNLKPELGSLIQAELDILKVSTVIEIATSAQLPKLEEESTLISNALPVLEDKQEDKEAPGNHSAEVKNSGYDLIRQEVKSILSPQKKSKNKNKKAKKSSRSSTPQENRASLSNQEASKNKKSTKKISKKSKISSGSFTKTTSKNSKEAKKQSYKRSASEPVKLSSNHTSLASQLLNDYKRDNPPKYVADLRELLGCEDKFCKDIAAFAVVLEMHKQELIAVEKQPKPVEIKRDSLEQAIDVEVQKLKRQAKKAKRKISKALKNISELNKIPDRFSFKLRKDSSKQLKLEVKAAEWNNNITEHKDLTLIEKNLERFNVLKQNPFVELGEWQAINAINFHEKLDQLSALFNDNAFLNYFTAMASITLDYSELIDLLTEFSAVQKKQLSEDKLKMFSGLGNCAILPVQRIMRYVLHIKDLRKDYENELGQTCDVLEKLEEYVEFITGMANRSSSSISGSSIRRAHLQHSSKSSVQVTPPASPRVTKGVNPQALAEALTQSMQQGGVLPSPRAKRGGSHNPLESPRVAATPQ